MSTLLIDSEDPFSKCFGARAWEREIITATAKRVDPTAGSEVIDRNDRPKEQLSALFIDKGAKARNAFETQIETANKQDLFIERLNAGDQVLKITTASQQSVNDPNPESVRLLKERIAELEEKIKFLESDDLKDDKEPTQVTDYELPQYILLAGVGACVIAGQAVLKKLLWSRI